MNNSRTTPNRRRVGRNQINAPKALTLDEILQPFKILKEECVDYDINDSIQESLVQSMYQIAITAEDNIIDAEIRNILYNLNCLYRFFNNKEIKQVFDIC